MTETKPVFKDDLSDLNIITKNVGELKEIIDGEQQKSYSPGFINRFFSYHPETVLIANSLNMNHHLDYRLQYDFLLNTIPPRKRFSKRVVDKQHHRQIAAIQQYYHVSYERAGAIKKILRPDEIEDIVKIIDEYKESRKI